MKSNKHLHSNLLVSASILLLSSALSVSHAQSLHGEPSKTPAWMDTSLSPDQRASMLLREMTLDEKTILMHGEGIDDWAHMSPEILAVRSQSNGGDGFVLGIPRLGIPAMQMDGAAYGVRFSAANGRYSTALPSNLASAASWDTNAACEYGALIGRELRAQGYNTSLSGGVNLTRDPRNGRTFEYMGEDPVLSGIMVGHRILCEGQQHVLSGIKHYALNDQESGRSVVDSNIDDRAMRESDLLAFQIGIRVGNPFSVMCSYNGINGTYACENKHLLTDILKQQWGFRGFVMSDWGATHSMAKALSAGLDQEQPLDEYFGPSIKAAVRSGQISTAELDEHVHRILWSMFASGIVDDPPKKSVIDPEAGFLISRRIAESSAVLLQNRNQALPLNAELLRTVAIIGRNADRSMVSGGGSAQVDPIGATSPAWRSQVWFPTAPLKALQARAPKTTFNFSNGDDVSEAVELAKHADVALVFAWQWEAEAADLPSLSLPAGQDALIAAVARANPHTIVVLETGGPVTTPWVQQTAAILETWYSGSKGADAVARLLFGDVSPSGKLPLTFPARENDLPRGTMARPPAGAPANTLDFHVDYTEGARVGYKWFQSEGIAPLFPFGFGLSYTTYVYSDLVVDSKRRSLTFNIKNVGIREGTEIAEVYARLPASAHENFNRLVGWKRVQLGAGQSKTLTLDLDPLYLSVFDEAKDAWQMNPGEYTILVGDSSQNLPLKRSLTLK